MVFGLDLRTTGGNLTAVVPARSGDGAGDGGRAVDSSGRGKKVMPLYEYTCATCGQDFEELVSLSSPPAKCPYCKSDKAEKKFSTFSSSAFSGKSKCASCTPKSGHS